MTVVGIIPARHASTRFPGKPLVPLCGKPMIQWVHERVSQAERLDDLLVATDDDRIRDCVESFGGRAVMTSTRHASGTDRLAEVAADLDADIVVNVQGDEPLMAPADVDRVVSCLSSGPVERKRPADMATLAAPITSASDFRSPSVVKVVLDDDDRALYFSRSPIPRSRESDATVPAGALRHLGIYAYRRDFLLEFAGWEPSTLEVTEGLEQLRALSHGADIRVALTHHVAPAVDTPDDVPAVEAMLRQQDSRPLPEGQG